MIMMKINIKITQVNNKILQLKMLKKESKKGIFRMFWKRLHFGEYYIVGSLMKIKSKF